MKKVLLIGGIVAAAVFAAKKLLGRKQDEAIEDDAPVASNGYLPQTQS